MSPITRVFSLRLRTLLLSSAEQFSGISSLRSPGRVSRPMLSTPCAFRSTTDYRSPASAKKPRGMHFEWQVHVFPVFLSPTAIEQSLEYTIPPTTTRDVRSPSHFTSRPPRSVTRTRFTKQKLVLTTTASKVASS